MPDSAADILAPPNPTWDPSWNPPPSGAIPAPNAPPAAPPAPPEAPELTGAVDPRAATDIPRQVATPYMLDPAAARDPNLGYTGVTPTPPDVHQHMSWIGRTLDKVATALGGGETLKITKLPDGTTTMQKVPATEGEKWGRIAAAALTGAGAGLQQSFGPGGMARATGAGIQTGAQLPQQAQQIKQQDVDTANKQLLFQANRIKLQQDIVRQSLENKEKNITMSEEEVARTQKLNDELQNSPWHDDLGNFPDMDAAMQAAQADPNLLKDHAQAKHRILPEYNKDGTVKGFHVYNEDPGYKESRNTTPLEAHTIKYVPDADGILKPTQETHIIPPNGITMGEHATAEDKFGLDYATAQNKYATTKKALAEKPEKPLTTSAQAYDDWRKETDPKEKDALWKEYKQLLADEMAKRAVTHVSVNQPSSQEAISNWADVLSDPTTNAKITDVKNQADRNAILAELKRRGASLTHPLTGDEIKRIDLANIAVDNLKDAQEVLNRRPEMFGPKGFLKKTFKDWLQGGDPDAHKFATAIALANLPLVGIHNVRGKYAVDDLAKEDADIYHNADAMALILDEASNAATRISQGGGRKLPARTAAAAAPAPAPAPAAPAPAPAAPGATPQPQNAPQLPDAQPVTPQSPVKYDKAGNAVQWQGNRWVSVKPPARR